MVAASIVDMNVRDGDNVRHVPAALTVFRIGGGREITSPANTMLNWAANSNGGLGLWGWGEFIMLQHPQTIHLACADGEVHRLAATSVVAGVLAPRRKLTLSHPLPWSNPDGDQHGRRMHMPADPLSPDG